MPNLAMTSSVTVRTGKLATTSFEAGGALGGCSMIPWQQKSDAPDQYSYILVQFQLTKADFDHDSRKLSHSWNTS